MHNLVFFIGSPRQDRTTVCAFVSYRYAGKDRVTPSGSQISVCVSEIPREVWGRGQHNHRPRNQVAGDNEIVIFSLAFTKYRLNICKPLCRIYLNTFLTKFLTVYCCLVYNWLTLNQFENMCCMVT